MKSMQKCLFIFSFLVLVSCGDNPLIAKHEASYNETKDKIIKNEALIEKVFELLPSNDVAMVKESRKRILQYDLKEFLESEKLSEKELLGMLEGVSFFIDQAEKRMEIEQQNKIDQMIIDERIMLERIIDEVMNKDE